MNEKLTALINDYERLAYTDNYILGFIDGEKIVMVYAYGKDLATVCKVDRASRNGGDSLRYKPNKAQKSYLKSKGIIELTTVEDFDAQVESSHYNNGEIFEKIVTEYFGQEWVKDFVPFTQGGDIEVNGTAYQIKFERATFASEKTLRRLAA